MDTQTSKPAGHALAGPPQPLIHPVELYSERPPIVFVPDPYNPGRSVAVDARLIQPPAPYHPRDLTPAPLFDPLAQRMIGAGVGGGAFAAGAGWGVGQALAPLAGVGSGGVLWLAFLLVAARTAASRPRVHHETHVVNHNRWMGRSTTNTHQR